MTSTPSTTATAPAEVAPADFTGYLIVYVLDGEGPGIWQVVRTPGAWCETCNANPENTPASQLYRTVALSHQFDPELGVCHRCLVGVWETRQDPRTPPSNDGLAYVYPPSDRV